MQQRNLKKNISGKEQLEAIRSNDEEALGHLYERNYPKFEMFVLKNSGTKDDAKDVYQESFIAMWRNVQLDKFYPESEHALNHYLLRIAKNKWLDHLRSNKFKLEVRMSKDLQAPAEDEILMEEVQYINEIKNKFKDLGENCREVLTSFYYRKESLKVIAENFQWTEATAKNNKYRCLQKLRKLIKGDNP